MKRILDKAKLEYTHRNDGHDDFFYIRVRPNVERLERLRGTWIDYENPPQPFRQAVHNMVIGLGLNGMLPQTHEYSTQLLIRDFVLDKMDRIDERHLKSAVIRVIATEKPRPPEALQKPQTGIRRLLGRLRLKRL